MTPQQRQLYDFIGRYWAEYGFAPTYEAITFALGLKTKSQVHRLVHAMVARGYLVIVPGLRRTVRCVAMEGKSWEDGFTAGWDACLADKTNFTGQDKDAG